MDITSLKTNTLEKDLIERHFSMFDEIASKTVHNLDDHDRQRKRIETLKKLTANKFERTP